MTRMNISQCYSCHGLQSWDHVDTSNTNLSHSSDD